MTTTKQIQVSKNELDKVQYLTEVLPEIPTNTILYPQIRNRPHMMTQRSKR